MSHSPRDFTYPVCNILIFLPFPKKGRGSLHQSFKHQVQRLLQPSLSQCKSERTLNSCAHPTITSELSQLQRACLKYLPGSSLTSRISQNLLPLEKQAAFYTYNKFYHHQCSIFGFTGKKETEKISKTRKAKIIMSPRRKKKKV